MHGKITADAVAGAVIEVEALRPQELAGKRIELRSGGPLGKDRAGDGDMAFEHAGETVAHLGGRLAPPDGGGGFGGAGLLLAPRGREEKIAPGNCTMCFGG